MGYVKSVSFTFFSSMNLLSNSKFSNVVAKLPILCCKIGHLCLVSKIKEKVFSFHHSEILTAMCL